MATRLTATTNRVERAAGANKGIGSIRSLDPSWTVPPVSPMALRVPGLGIPNAG